MKDLLHKTKHEETLQRLARVEGQVHGIRKMIEEEKYCIDIVNQVEAAASALKAVGRQVLQKHIETCLADAVRSGSDSEFKEKVDEIMLVIKKGQ